MIKVICDTCGDEAKGQNFMFDAQVKQVISTINSKTFEGGNKMVTTGYQLCEKCYKDKFVPLLK